MFIFIVKIVIVLSFLGLVFIVLKYNRIMYRGQNLSFKELHLHIINSSYSLYKNFINSKINKLKPIIVKYLSGAFIYIKKFFSFIILQLKNLESKIAVLYYNINEKKRLRKEMINNNKIFFEDILIDKKENQQENEKKQEKIFGFHEVNINNNTDNKNEDNIDLEILSQKEKNLLEAIVKNPSDISFYKKLGKVYMAMNNFDDAKNCFQYVIKLGSKDKEIKELLDKISV
ncbi:MAG: tetratricopeptide repeat protein [Patescibacteria group bacterium]